MLYDPDLFKIRPGIKVSWYDVVFTYHWLYSTIENPRSFDPSSYILTTIPKRDKI